MTLTAAMTTNQVVGVQLIQGGMDGSLFENFIFNVVTALLADPKNNGRRIVLFLDNCRLHKVDLVLSSAKRLGVGVVFSAQYSPFLMAIEHLFKYVKHRIRLIQPRYSR